MVRQGDRVRVRIGNLTMTNHPIHMHGYHFMSPAPMAAGCRRARALPEVSTDVPVGAMRAYEFVADEPGDWAIHCHKSHHTMNAMGHDVKTFIGVNKKDLARTIRKLVPDYMPMGAAGMAEMGEMEMPMPDNTLPMMTGFGQFGPMEMGGMFSVVKVREGIARDDYKDPGPYKIRRAPSPTKSRASPAARRSRANPTSRRAARPPPNLTSSSRAARGPTKHQH